ncbi:MAG: transposase [Thermoplasmata archaeon]
MFTDLGESAEKIYEMYKRRKEIEEAFDTLKNTPEVDKTWMQSREKIQGYLFVMLLSLLLNEIPKSAQKLLEKLEDDILPKT